MRNIKKFLLIAIVIILWISYNQSLAYTPDFSDFEISSSYSLASEKLDLKFELEDVYDRPSYPYYIKIKINDRTYTSNLVYSSSSEKLYSFFSINIDKDDIKSYYYMNYYIINDDNNSTKYYKLNYKVDIPLDNFLKWSNLKLSSSYDENAEELKLVFSFPNIPKLPANDYYMRLKIDNKNYESEMIYDTTWKKLYAFFNIDIDKNILRPYYYIDYSVINDDNNSQVYSISSYRLNSETSNLDSLKEKLNWSNMKVTNTYNKDQEYVKIAFNLTNIKYKPKENYYIKVDMWTSSDSIYTSDLIYDARDDKLSTIFYIDTPRRNLKPYYYIKYYVYTDKELKAYSNTNYKLDISNYNYYYNYNNYNNTNCYNNNSGYWYNNVYYTCNNNNTYYYNDNNISWSNTNIISSYDSYNWKLTIDYYVTSVYNNPSKRYYAKIYINWSYYIAYFSYESYNNQLHAIINLYISSNNINSSYYITYYVMDDNNQSIHSNSETIYTGYNSNNYYYNEGYYYKNWVYYKINDYNNYYYNNNDDNNYYYKEGYYYKNGVYYKVNDYDNNYNNNYDNTNDSESYKYAWDKIKVIESNHYNSTDRKYYINQEIDYLRKNSFYDSSFKSNAIDIFNTRLNNY